MKIGVFDSGVGGLSVVKAIEQALPQSEIWFVKDEVNFPYATKTPEQIWEGLVPIFDKLVAWDPDVIVIACNTVSTTLSGRLREKYSDLPFVALDPMVKPAAEATKTGKIAVCATPVTLASQRYAELKAEFAKNIEVIEPDCSDWSYLIEHDAMDEERLTQEIEPVLAAGADVVVLACTHYHWIETQIKELAEGRATVLQPEAAIIRQLKRVLKVED